MYFSQFWTPESPKIKVLIDLVSSEGLLPSQMANGYLVAVSSHAEDSREEALLGPFL